MPVVDGAEVVQLPAAAAAAAPVPSAAAVPATAALAPRAASPFQAAVRRLAAPLGEWAKPRAADSTSKAQAGADFESRAFGAPGEGEAPPPAPSERAPSQPPSSSGPRLSGPRAMVLVTLEAPKDEAEKAALLARLSAQYGYEHDFGFTPHVTLSLMTVRGVVPQAKLAALRADPAVRDVYPAFAGVEKLVRAPYERPKARENLLRAGMRAVHERSEGLALLAMAPVAFGTLLLFGPLVGAAVLPAAFSFVSGALLGGFLATMTIVSIGGLPSLNKVPAWLRGAAVQSFQAAGALWLAGHGHPALGAWSAVNAALAAAALPLVLSRLKRYKSEHPVDDAVNKVELSALVTALGLGLTTLAWIALSPAFAVKALAAGTVLLLSLLAPAPERGADKPGAAPPAGRPALLARYNELLGRAARARRSHRRALIAAAVLTLSAPWLFAGLLALEVHDMILLEKTIIVAALALAVGLFARIVQLIARRARLSRAFSRTQRTLIGEDNPRSPAEAAAAAARIAEEASAVAYVARRRPALGQLVAALRRVGLEARAEPLDRELSAAADLRGASVQSAALRLHAAAAPAIAAYRRALWEQGSLEPKELARADANVAALERELAASAGVEREADAELVLAAERLDRLYDELERSGPDARRAALALEAVEQARWAWLGRGKWSGPRLLMSLSGRVSIQLSEFAAGKPVPAERVEELRDETRQILEAVVEALHDDERALL